MEREWQISGRRSSKVTRSHMSSAQLLCSAKCQAVNFNRCLFLAFPSNLSRVLRHYPYIASRIKLCKYMLSITFMFSDDL